MVNNTNKEWRSLLWVGNFLSLFMFQSPFFSTSNYPIFLQIVGFVAMVLKSKCAKLLVNISNDCKVTDIRVYPLCTGSRTVKSF